jgi:hypothetical protein
MIEDFFHLPTVSTTPVVHLELRIRKFSKKSGTTLMVYSGAWGETDSWKKQEIEKSRDTVPLILG